MKKWGILLCLLLLFGTARAEEDLSGVWSFTGGGEVMGMGFTLNADGTGQWMDTGDQHTLAKHLKETGERFVWTLEGDTFTCTNASGADYSYSIFWDDGRLHFASGDGGGFYKRFDEKAMRAEIESKRQAGIATEFDLLALDYLDDALEAALAEQCGLRSVNADVDWDTEAPRITVDAWHIEKDASVWLRLTPEGAEAYATVTPWEGMEEDDISRQPFTCSPGAANDNVCYVSAQWALEAALKAMTGENRLRKALSQDTADAVADRFEQAVADYENGDFERILAGMGFTVQSAAGDENGITARLLYTAENRAFDFSLTPYYETLTLEDTDAEKPLSHELYVQEDESVYDIIPQAADSLIDWERRQAQPAPPVALQGKTAAFPKGKGYDVYRGPGKSYGRGADGKARVSTAGPIAVYGVWNDWLLISYDVSKDKARFGWIETAGLPESVLAACPELAFERDTMEYRLGVLRREAPLTDDPQHSHAAFDTLPKAASLHCLGLWEDWMLVEGFKNEKLIMGFVPADAVDMEHGDADDTRFVIENAVSWPESEIAAAMEAVREAYRLDGAGSHLLAVRYPEEENDPANIWWRVDGVHPDIQFIRLYADVDCIGYYDFEISSYGVAKDLIVYCSRAPGES